MGISTRIILRKYLLALGNHLCRINKRPLLILGNQKSGTTVVAALLQQITGVSATLDITRAIKDVSILMRLRYGLEDISEFIERYRCEFSKTIIKEPGLTFVWDQLSVYFPGATYVFVQRDPRDNIRSVLNRLKIPGHLPNIDPNEYEELNKKNPWRLALDSTWLGRPSDTYIEGLAYRWVIATEAYQRNSNKTILVRYEDFKAAKVETIHRLAEKCGLQARFDISDKVDVQYQSKGQSHIKWEEFYGQDNLARIDEICGPFMVDFNYQPACLQSRAQCEKP